MESVFEIERTGKNRLKEQIQVLDEKSIEYLSSTRDHHRDLIRFLVTLKKFASLYQNAHLNTVILWLELNDIKSN